MKSGSEIEEHSWLTELPLNVAHELGQRMPCEDLINTCKAMRFRDWCKDNEQLKRCIFGTSEPRIWNHGPTDVIKIDYNRCIDEAIDKYTEDFQNVIAEYDDQEYYTYDLEPSEDGIFVLGRQPTDEPAGANRQPLRTFPFTTRRQHAVQRPGRVGGVVGSE